MIIQTVKDTALGGTFLLVVLHVTDNSDVFSGHGAKGGLFLLFFMGLSYIKNLIKADNKAKFEAQRKDDEVGK